MEERQSIIALGAGAVSKIFYQENRLNAFQTSKCGTICLESMKQSKGKKELRKLVQFSLTVSSSSL